jgi:hypothetical protein
MVFPEALHVVALCRLWKSNHLRTTWGATQSNGGKLFIAQPVNEENSMQAVVPFVVMIVLLAVIFYLARWDANRVKSKH